jgi:hypothetical protein
LINNRLDELLKITGTFHFPEGIYLLRRTTADQRTASTAANMATDMMILSTTEPSTEENSPKKLSCFHVYGRETIRAMDEKFQARRLREPGPNQLALLAYIDAVRCLLLDRTLRWPLEVAEDYPLHRLIKRLSENKDHLYDQWLPELSQYASHSIFYDDAAVDDLGLWKDSEPCGMALIAPMSLDLKDKHCEMNFRTFMEAAKLKGRMYPEEIFRTVEWKRGQAVLRSPLYAHVYNQMQGSWPSLLVQPHKQLEEQGLFQPHMKSSYEKMDLVAGYQRGEGAIIDPPSNLNEVGIRGKQ